MHPHYEFPPKKMTKKYACKYPHCKNSYIRNLPKGRKNMRFFHFPKDPVVLDIWKEICGISSTKNVSNFRLCMEHFSVSDFSEITMRGHLKKTAVPKLSQKIHPLEDHDKGHSSDSRSEPSIDPLLPDHNHAGNNYAPSSSTSLKSFTGHLEKKTLLKPSQIIDSSNDHDNIKQFKPTIQFIGVNSKSVNTAQNSSCNIPIVYESKNLLKSSDGCSKPSIHVPLSDYNHAVENNTPSTSTYLQSYTEFLKRIAKLNEWQNIDPHNDHDYYRQFRPIVRFPDRKAKNPTVCDKESSDSNSNPSMDPLLLDDNCSDNNLTTNSSKSSLTDDSQLNVSDNIVKSSVSNFPLSRKKIKYCKYPSCKNSYIPDVPESYKNKRFFQFPKDPSILKRWKDICRNPHAKSVSNLRVCSEHFSESDFTEPNKLGYLKKNAVPKESENIDSINDLEPSRPTIQSSDETSESVNISRNSSENDPKVCDIEYHLEHSNSSNNPNIDPLLSDDNNAQSCSYTEHLEKKAVPKPSQKIYLITDHDYNWQSQPTIQSPNETLESVNISRNSSENDLEVCDIEYHLESSNSSNNPNIDPLLSDDDNAPSSSYTEHLEKKAVPKSSQKKYLITDHDYNWQSQPTIQSPGETSESVNISRNSSENDLKVCDIEYHLECSNSSNNPNIDPLLSDHNYTPSSSYIEHLEKKAVPKPSKKIDWINDHDYNRQSQPTIQCTGSTSEPVKTTQNSSDIPIVYDIKNNLKYPLLYDHNLTGNNSTTSLPSSSKPKHSHLKDPNHTEMSSISNISLLGRDIKYSCKYPLCKNSYMSNLPKGYKNLRFFHFPKDPSILKIWKDICGIEESKKVTNLRLCSDHFVVSDFTETTMLGHLKKKAVPKPSQKNFSLIDSSDSDVPIICDDAFLSKNSDSSTKFSIESPQINREDNNSLPSNSTWSKSSIDNILTEHNYASNTNPTESSGCSSPINNSCQNMKK